MKYVFPVNMALGYINVFMAIFSKYNGIDGTFSLLIGVFFILVAIAMRMDSAKNE